MAATDLRIFHIWRTNKVVLKSARRTREAYARLLALLQECAETKTGTSC